MARMYPPELPAGVESRAEIDLFPRLASDLPDAYQVYHSVAWQSRGRYGARDGEADFVIVHPDKGILVIEAKAGTIRYDGQNREWYQNGRLMEKDPFEQAKRSIYHLQRTLQEEPYWRQRMPLYGHAVAFTDIVVPSQGMALFAPKAIICDQRDLQDIAAWVAGAFQHYQGESRSNIIEKTGLEYLNHMFAPIIETRSLMQLEIEREEEQLVRLTEEQYRFLNFTRGQRRAAIAGCAGSGKTMLAAEKAKRLALQGWRVLLTCFNVNLANFLRYEHLADVEGTLEIAHFHEVAGRLIRQSGQRVTPEQLLSEQLPDLLAQACDTLGPQFDAIVVDEAQDFQESWWLPLQLLLSEPDEGTLYIFYDDNQNLYGGLQQIKNIASTYALTENCRNTQKIHETVAGFYRSENSLTARGPAGRPVEILSYSDDSELVRHLRRTVHQLVQVENIPPEDIVVLTPYQPHNSALSKAPRLGNFVLTTNWDIDDNELYYGTIHSFKGLESPVVILVELNERLPNLDTLFYVGCSRARNHLVVICHDLVRDYFATE
ncbi:MAG: NERD domain-containing protein [Anaerolineales bacterium]|nr:NERD domain-containing protein [Anaerolineales bacterium]